MSSHLANNAQALVVFPCASCGKSLRSRTELVGKKVQCPHCLQMMLVPPIDRVGPPKPIWRLLLPPLLLALILWSTFVLKLNNLEHTALTRWDEAFHAVVAQNVLKHPFEPTLIDTPYLPYDYKRWGENHVWLHKPILPFWQVALSLAVFGVNAFALRLPAAILSTGAAWLTYLIGKELLDRRSALIAAALQAANPFLMTLVHGYHFADNIDVALLFWTEVGIYFLVRSLRTGSWREVLLAGLAQGLAFLCKSYLAGIIFGIALAAWLLPLVRLAEPMEGRTIVPRMSILRLLGLLGITILTVAPWLVYCATEYPEAFWHEHGQVWKHLHSNVENWAAPWDRVVFDYLIAIYGVFYTPVLIAAVIFAGKAVTHRHMGLLLVYAWGLGVILPHLFAVTKTPSATLLAMPALLLLLGHLVAEAWRGERWPLVGLTAILFMSLIMPAVVKDPGHGYPSSREFGAVMRQSWWVVYHVAGALAIATILVSVWALLGRLRRGSETTEKQAGAVDRTIHAAALVFCGCVLAWVGMQTLDAAWRVTNANVNDPFSVEVGQFARDHLPGNAVLLCAERKGYEHLTIMFYADRTCYALPWRGPDEIAGQINEAGGIPYVVSYRSLTLPSVHVCENQGPTVYLWQPPPPRPGSRKVQPKNR